MFNLTVVIDVMSARLETRCFLKCDRVPSDSTKFQDLEWIDLDPE